MLSFPHDHFGLRFKLMIAAAVILLASLTLAAIHDTSPPGTTQDFLSDIPITVSGGSVDLLVVRKHCPGGGGKHRCDKARFDGLQVVSGGDVYYGLMPASSGIKLTITCQPVKRGAPFDIIIDSTKGDGVDISFDEGKMPLKKGHSDRNYTADYTIKSVTYTDVSGANLRCYRAGDTSKTPVPWAQMGNPATSTITSNWKPSQ